MFLVLAREGEGKQPSRASQAQARRRQQRRRMSHSDSPERTATRPASPVKTLTQRGRKYSIHSSKTSSPAKFGTAPHFPRRQHIDANTKYPTEFTERGGSPPMSSNSQSASNVASPFVESGSAPPNPLCHASLLIGREDTKPAVTTRHQRQLQQVTPTKSQLSHRANVARRGTTFEQEPLDEAFLSRMQSLAVQGGQGRTPRENCKQRLNSRWMAVTVGVALVSLVLVTCLVVLFGRGSLVRPRRTCSTASCHRLAAEILGRLNRSVNPCDDIQAHVCGSIRWEGTLVTDAATDMMRKWQMQGAAHLEVEKRPEGPFALYRACMEPGRDSMHHLVSFMRDRRLKWPEYGSMGRHALNVLLDLLINWGIPFWFEMSLRKLPNKSRYSLYINRVMMNKWRRQQQISADQGLLTQYAMFFYDVFNASTDDRARIPRLLALEKEMHAIIDTPTVKDSNTRDAITVLQVTFRTVSVFTKNITTDTWLVNLNEHMHPHHFQPDDSVLVDDLSLAKVTNDLFAGYSNEDMLYVLGWWFAQQFTVIASLDGGVASYGSAVVAESNRPLDCYTFAESRFRRQLFRERARASLGSAGIQQVEELLERIRNATIQLLMSLPWFDEEARKEGAAIVAATRFESREWDFKPVTGPGERYFTAALQAAEREATGHKEIHGLPLWMWASLSVGQQERIGAASDISGLKKGDNLRSRPLYSTAIQGWIESAREYKSRFPNWPRDDSLQHRHLYFSSLSHYDYWWNSVFLQMGAIAEPLFYLDASLSAANYGGLGFVVAKQLVKAFDFQRGTRLNSKRQSGSWISPSSVSDYESKINCANGSNRALDHIAALEIALAAAFGPTDAGQKETAERDDPGKWLPSKGEFYSSEMVFFLIYCRATCGSTKLNCGDVLKHMARFGRAFRCPKNSPMRSGIKCTFFGK